MNKVIDESYIADRMRQEEQIDCLAIVISSWHYLHALATIRFLKAQGKVRKAIILAGPHGRNGIIVDQCLWESEETDIEKYCFQAKDLPPLQKVAKYLADKRIKGRDFYLLRAVGPSPELAAALWQTGLHRNYISVVIDEGLGYYLRNTKGWLLETGKQGWSRLEFAEKMFKEWMYQRYTKIALKCRKQLIYNTFFLRRRRKLTVNCECIDCLREVMEDAVHLYSHVEGTIYENRLIICTQVFHDLGQIRNDADMVVIRQICNEAEKNHIGVVIKPHPRETDIDKYRGLGAEVEENHGVPMEIMLAGLQRKPVALVGITTTSLVSASVLWGMKTFSIVGLVGQENFAREVREDIDHFPRIFAKYVTLPKTVNDIFTHIRNGDVEHDQI